MLVALILLRLEKASLRLMLSVKTSQDMLYTHTRTQASSYAHSDRPIQYFQIQELSISSFSLNLLFFLDPVFSYSAPNGHSPFSRG